MKFIPTSLDGSWIVEMEPRGDTRGFFARAWCEREAAAVGLHPRWVQANTSLSRDVGTLRGMHYQKAPWQEAKLVRCTRGAIYDVIIDLRPKRTVQRSGLKITGALVVEIKDLNIHLRKLPSGSRLLFYCT